MMQTCKNYAEILGANRIADISGPMVLSVGDALPKILTHTSAGGETVSAPPVENASATD